MATLQTSIQEHASNWAELQSQRNYLADLFNNEELNDQQIDYVSDYTNYITDQIENFESFLMDEDKYGRYYQHVLKEARKLANRPSDKFINNISINLSEMDMDDLEFQIHEAVTKYNSFFYSCAIWINSHGYVGFNGCHMESNYSATVLFNKKDKNRVTIQEVKNKITKIKK